MDPRTPNFTLVLEEPLRRLAKNPALVLAGLNNRYGLKPGDLQLWLDTFNAGKRELTAARIDEVKAEIGLIKSGAVADAEPASTHIEGPASATGGAKPPEERMNNSVRGPLIETCKILAENPGMAESVAAKKAGCVSWWYPKHREFGKGPLDHGKLVAWLRDRGITITIAAAPEPGVKLPEKPKPAPNHDQETRAPKKQSQRPPRHQTVQAEVEAVAGPPPDSDGVTELHPVRVRLQLEVSVRVRSLSVEP